MKVPNTIETQCRTGKAPSCSQMSSSSMLARREGWQNGLCGPKTRVPRLDSPDAREKCLWLTHGPCCSDASVLQEEPPPVSKYQQLPTATWRSRCPLSCGSIPARVSGWPPPRPHTPAQCDWQPSQAENLCSENMHNSIYASEAQRVPQGQI